ncbi:hypothetical protein DEO72_LG1g2867 [Vigna unguiculata]|uniref:Uncharacterized protein n=1 Tax=Vigna unguiculata TaxID=3917 RepID=A0A4D6KNJ2_VIGUN|nr:hypothetical protein DEO72_LG1g2867 [Vigna unguiculata]
MGVLRLQNVAPTQLHPNSWAYLQAFRILSRSLYMQPSPQAFLYFHDTRPRQPTTWLSLDGFFKAVVKEAVRSYFHNDDGSTKFSLSWTDNPWRYKDMKIEKLSVADKEVVETPMKFNDRLPTKGLVRFYNSVHLIVDIEAFGVNNAWHMPQLGNKNLTLFQTLRKEKATKSKAAGSTEVPNLQEFLVEVHVHRGKKRKAELPARYDGGKDVKKVRATLLGPGFSETLVNSIDNMESNAMVKAMVEFSSKALILARRVVVCCKGS